VEKLKRIGPAMLLIVLLVAGWHVVVVQSASLIFPGPGQVIAGTVELARNGTLWQHIAASLLRVTTGFLLAVLVAVPTGLWMGRVSAVYHTLNPVFQILRPISPIAWIPLAILWFGVGDVAPVFLIFLAAVFPMIVQTANGVHTIEQRYLHAAMNFGVSRRKMFHQVIVPAVLPDIVVGMRIALGVAWLVVVAAEMIVRNSGLGYLIIDARNAGNRYDLVVAGMVIIGVIGLLLDALMRRLEGLNSVRWRYGR
jgi:NitT/TauT family transport system permease protein